MSAVAFAEHVGAHVHGERGDIYSLLLHVHPSVVVGVVALGLLYGLATVALRRRPTRRAVAAFGGALAVLLLALGPVDGLADHRLFTAHMGQHMLLSLVVPPLFLLGVPDWMVRSLLRCGPVARLARLLVHPIVAFVLYNGYVAVLHTPPAYELMVRDEVIHITLHLCLMVTGTIMWWPLLSPLPELPRLPYAAQVLYLFLMLVPMAAVSAPITLASTVIYPWYLEGPHPWGIAPLTDQVWGGLLMWVGGGIYFMGVFSTIFFRWAQREAHDALPTGSIAWMAETPPLP
jgi:putative membrane protein